MPRLRHFRSPGSLRLDPRATELIKKAFASQEDAYRVGKSAPPQPTLSTNELHHLSGQCRIQGRRSRPALQARTAWGSRTPARPRSRCTPPPALLPPAKGRRTPGDGCYSPHSDGSNAPRLITNPCCKPARSRLLRKPTTCLNGTMTLYALKPRFQNLRPIAARLASPRASRPTR